MDDIALNYQEVIKCPHNIFEQSIQTQMTHIKEGNVGQFLGIFENT